MATAVVGFDVGSLTSYIGAAKSGGIEVLVNEYSDRCTPTCVSFGKGGRMIGTSAEQQSITNLKNTASTFTRLLGKMFDDDIVTKESEFAHYCIKPASKGRAGIEMEIEGQLVVLLPEQLMAMQLRKLTEISEKCLGCRVVDVVLNVPTFYTDRERRAVLDASRIAGLNCMRLVNDTTAIGLAYGIYNRDLPAPEEAPRNVAFVSLGNSNLQVSIIAFNQGKMRVISTACDPNIGGRDFDMCIFKHMVDEIRDKYKLDIMKSPKAKARLMKACEKLKKVMSTNSTDIPLNVECLMEDRDFSSKMKREFFEELSKPILSNIKMTLKRALHLSNLTEADIQFVEFVGGGTRIPAVKSLANEVFGKEGRTTLNADEAVARGCGLQAAICSPAYKVRDFNVAEVCQYSIILAEIDKNPDPQEVTYYKKSDFMLKAVYAEPQHLHIRDHEIGSFQIEGVVPDDDNKCEIRVKVRLDANGLFSVRKALMVDKVEKEVEVPIEEKANAEAPKSAPSDTKAVGDSQSSAEAPEMPTTQLEPMSVDPAASTEEVKNETGLKTQKVKKWVARTREIKVTTKNGQLSQQELTDFSDFEANLSQTDKLEKERQHLKNSVEEYVYDIRSRLEDSLSAYVLDAERSQYMVQLTETEGWIYGDGADAKRNELKQRLDNLTVLGERYKKRMYESGNRPGAIDYLSRTYTHIKQVLEKYNAKDPAYDHLLAEDMNKVNGWLKEAEAYLHDTITQTSKLKKTDDPTILSEHIIEKATSLDSKCKPIISRPRPVPPPPAPNETITTEKGAAPTLDNVAEDMQKPSPNLKANGVNPVDEDMDVD